MADLKKSVAIEFETNAAKAAKDVDKLAKANEGVAKSTDKASKSQKDGISKLEIFNMRTRNAADAQKKLAQQQRAAADAQRQQREAMISGAKAIAGWGIAAGAAASAVEKVSARALKLSEVSRNLSFSIDKARAVSGGLVDTFTLQQQAMAANTLGAAKTSDEFARLVKVATTLARVQGKDATKGVEDFTTALARGSPQILDNLGLTLKHSEAQAIYAKHLGVAASSLSDAQKAEAFRFAALQKGEQVIKNVNLQTKGWALEVQRLKTDLVEAFDLLVQLPDKIDKAREAEENASIASKAWAASIDVAVNSGTSLFNSLTGNVIPATTELIHGMAEVNRATQDAVKEQEAIATSLDDTAANVAILTGLWLGLESAISGGVGQIGIFDEATHEIDKQVALLEGQKGTEAEINRLRNERAQLEIGMAKLRGDERSATEAARAEELRQIKEANGLLTRKKSGGRSGGGEADSVDYSELRQLNEGSFGVSDEELERRQAMREAELEAERAHMDVRLQMQLDDLEMRKELGLDPITAIDLEEQAKLEYYERELEMLAEQNASEAEMIAARDQLRQTSHEADMKRLAAQRDAAKRAQEAEQAKFASFVAGARAWMDVANETASIASAVADAQGMSAERAARLQNRFLGMQAFGRAALEVVEAIAAAARYDYGAAALHGAAAALGVVKGGLLVSGALDPSGEGDASGAGGGASGAPGLSGSGPASNTAPTDVPISRPNSGAPPQNGTSGRSSNGGGNSNVVNIGTVNTLATSDEELGLKLRNVMNDSERMVGGT